MNGSPATGDPVFPMFVGCGRSGTTLFRNIFDSHPDLAMTHEAHFIAPMGARRERYTNRAGGLDIDAFVADLFADSNFRRQGLEENLVRRSLEESSASGFAEAVRVVFGLYAAAQGKRLYGDKTPGSVTQIELLGSLFPEARFVHIIRDGRAVALSYLERPEWGPKTMAEAAQHWKSRVT
ncbi:MAG: sulfotransferase, partial [Acidimicrobiia bacterium]|nr:sulfotransferase [Acidimicrobiia bacterium]